MLRKAADHLADAGWGAVTEVAEAPGAQQGSGSSGATLIMNEVRVLQQEQMLSTTSIDFRTRSMASSGSQPCLTRPAT